MVNLLNFYCIILQTKLTIYTVVNLPMQLLLSKAFSDFRLIKL